MASAVNNDVRKKANLRLLQRTFDPSMEDIVGSATHAVLYEYINPQGWEKSQVEGSVFLVQKPGPSYSLAILNRSSTENFEVQVTKTFQLQHKEPYLIFKQSPKILGIWFHSSDERIVMASLLNQVIANLQQQQQAPISVPTPPPQQQQPQYHHQQQQSLPPQQAAIATTSIPLQPNGSSPGGMSSPVAHHQQQQYSTPSNSTRSNPAANASPSSSALMMEPLMNALFVSPAGAAAVGAASSSSSPAPSTTAAAAASSLPAGVALDKKSLQLALLSLIQDDRFIDLLHAQYLKVAHARARKDGKK